MIREKFFSDYGQIMSTDFILFLCKNEYISLNRIIYPITVAYLKRSSQYDFCWLPSRWCIDLVHMSSIQLSAVHCRHSCAFVVAVFAVHTGTSIVSKSLFPTPQALTSIPGQSKSYYPLRTVSLCTIVVTLFEKASIERRV